MGVRISPARELSTPEIERGLLFWAGPVADGWEEVLAELTEAFVASRESAARGESFVYIVGTDDLLGRNGPGPAMVASGLLSAARTAALEGAGKGWTANVVATDPETDPAVALSWAQRLLETDDLDGEVIRLGPGHLGKALP